MRAIPAAMFGTPPWRDRAGRFVWLKAAVLAFVLAPALALVVDWAGDGLGAKPLEEILRRTGDWAVRLLAAALAVTPLRRLWQWPGLLAVRRMVGLAALAYAALHFVAYMADQSFVLSRIASEIAARIYLTIGFAALLMLLVLGATSTDGMIRRLGGRAWRRLHRAVYLAAPLACLHFLLQAKRDRHEALVLAGVTAWLLAWRFVEARWPEAARDPVRLAAGLGVACGAATALGETAWLWIGRGVDPALVLAANVTFQAGIRPGVAVLGLALAAAAIGAMRRRAARDVSGAPAVRSVPPAGTVRR